MKTGPTRPASGKTPSRRRGNSSAASATRARTSGSARSSQATPTSSSSSESSTVGSYPSARTPSSSSHTPTEPAIGPAWSKLGASGNTPSVETSPYVGLKPTVPQQAAGIRIDQPETVPRAHSARPAATEDAEPPHDHAA